MTEQLSLALARNTDPHTSHVAARTCNAQVQRRQIIVELAHVGMRGLTTEELEDRLGIVRNTIASRLNQMKGDGLVEVFGERRNRNNKPMQVWHLSFKPRVVDVETGTRL